MMNRSIPAIVSAFLLAVIWLAPPRGEATRAAAAGSDAERPYGIDVRTPWTGSRVTGSPEPPPRFRTEPAFPKLKFKNPLALVVAPGSDRLFVVEQAGKLYSFPNDPRCQAADLFLDLPREIRTLDPDGPARRVGDAYGLAFHPDFKTNRYCYVCYTLVSKKEGEQLADGTRVSRFRVSDTDPPRCEPESETILITWLAGGHNGGCLAFGPDGCLYISTGDAANPNPPDVLDAGQDVTTLLSSILRIDVDHPADDRPYTIPPDNPFVGMPGARGEKWAYGLRNPWRMSFDRSTGELWVGDVGWELWEMVYRVERGGNYGWSIMEGPQPVHPDGKRGPTPIVPPMIALAHSESASVTGGYVYRGNRFKDLVGAYIFGDWETRRIWAARFDGGTLQSREELAEPMLRVVAFGEDHDGELYIVDYDDGTIYRLAPNESGAAAQEFPRRLSETGLFASVADLEPAPGVLPFSINAEQWADYATFERWLGLPGDSAIRMHRAPVEVPGQITRRRLDFPRDAVLANTISLELERGNPASRRRIETQLLHFNGKTWQAYSYAWNEDESDASLVAAEGAERSFTISDAAAPGGKRRQTWTFAARASCLRCHNPWAQHTLAFNIAEIDRAQRYGAVSDNQLRTLEHIGVLVAVPDPSAGGGTPEPAAGRRAARLVNPYDASADLEARARSYLQVNCAHCHQMGAGGTADIELRFDVPVGETKTLGVRPVQGAFGIADAQIVAPGDPYRSVLFYRLAKLGRGRMPHIGSDFIDPLGLDLIHDWIRSLPAHARETAVIDRLRAAEEEAVARERARASDEVEQLAREIAQASGRDGVSAADRAEAERRARQRAADRAAARARGSAGDIAELLGSTSSALVLARAVAHDRLPPALRAQTIAAARAHLDSQVRDLFERFVPDDERAQRVGSVIRAAEILAMAGDAERGRELFMNAPGLQCKTCHRVGETGGSAGPDLSHIGTKHNRAGLLENIVEPSKTIEPKYASYTVATTAGQLHTGVLVEKTAEGLVLRDAQDREIRIAAADVEQLVPQKLSIMPEQLLRDMTAQQVADLLAYMEGLK